MTPSSEALSCGTGCAGEEQHRLNQNPSVTGGADL